MGGSLLWIPTALSTLISVTSPRLSTIELNFARSSAVTPPVETVIENTINDLRRVAEEVARIERAFKGRVSVTILRDVGFKVVLDTLN